MKSRNWMKLFLEFCNSKNSTVLKLLKWSTKPASDTEKSTLVLSTQSSDNLSEKDLLRGKVGLMLLEEARNREDIIVLLIPEELSSMNVSSLSADYLIPQTQKSRQHNTFVTKFLAIPIAHILELEKDKAIEVAEGFREREQYLIDNEGYSRLFVNFILFGNLSVYLIQSFLLPAMDKVADLYRKIKEITLTHN